MKMRTYGMVPIALFILLRMGEAYAETEPAEITIHILGGHKAVISALLEAVDGGTPVTGIAELDSLAATYGLIGIYRKGRSSGFYRYRFRPTFGYRFRLTFPSGADVAAISGAYWSLPYIQLTKPDPLPEAQARKMHRPFDVENVRLRLPAKVGAGTASGAVFTAVAVKGNILLGAIIGCSVGFPLGASSIDPYDSLPITLLAGVIPGAAGILWLSNSNSSNGFVMGFVGPIIGSLYASEKSREPPQARRISFALSPTPDSGLSAAITLHF